MVSLSTDQKYHTEWILTCAPYNLDLQNVTLIFKVKGQSHCEIALNDDILRTVVGS